jgi:NADPH:quinone reductase
MPAANIMALHHIPPSWSYTQAASLGATLPVSYGALKVRGTLRPGEVVLVHSAAGGLGLAAVQLARALGCRVIGTAGSALKCAIAEKFGAEKCINYTTNAKWWEEVNRITGQRGVDIVFDPVGLVSDSLRCLAHQGRLLVVGFAGREGNLEAVKMNRVLLSQATVIGYVSNHLTILSQQLCSA